MDLNTSEENVLQLVAVITKVFKSLNKNWPLNLVKSVSSVVSIFSTIKRGKIAKLTLWIGALQLLSAHEWILPLVAV